MFGICSVPVAPVYASPTDRSVMVSQILAGEKIEVIELEDPWIMVINLNDHVRGWVDRKMFEELFEGEDNAFAGKPAGVIKPPLYCARDQYGRNFCLPAGSRLYLHGSSIAVAPGRNLEGDVRHHIFMPAYTSGKDIVATALLFNGAPYLRGGKTIFGMDAAGLIQITSCLNGIRIPRMLEDQVETGTVVSFSEEAQPGDIAFFENTDGTISHAGLVMEGGRIVHAYGEVRVDLFDHEGIFNKHTRQYTHKLRVIKRIHDPHTHNQQPA